MKRPRIYKRIFIEDEFRQANLEEDEDALRDLRFTNQSLLIQNKRDNDFIDYVDKYNLKNKKKFKKEY